MTYFDWSLVFLLNGAVIAYALWRGRDTESSSDWFLAGRTLPWWISVAALVYVFGYATDWRALLAATRNANLTVFLLLTAADKLVFF